MLIIRKRQIQHFILNDEDEFVRFLMEHIREESPERVPGYPDNLLEEMVRTGIARARAHEFQRGEDIAGFVALMFEVAPNFDEQSDIRKALGDRTVAIEQRLDQLWNLVPEEAWEEAEENYDADAWFPHNPENEPEDDNNAADA